MCRSTIAAVEEYEEGEEEEEEEEEEGRGGEEVALVPGLKYPPCSVGYAPFSPAA